MLASASERLLLLILALIQFTHLLNYGQIGRLAAGTSLLCLWIAPRMRVERD